MPSPDKLVELHGDNITISRVVDFDMGQDGVSNVTREFEHTVGVVSSPSEDDAKRPEGRVDTGDITVTVQSDTDLEVERPGGRDRILLGHVDPATATDVDAYSVIDLSDDTHNFADIRKLTATCERWTGATLQDDAATYTEV